MFCAINLKIKENAFFMTDKNNLIKQSIVRPAKQNKKFNKCFIKFLFVNFKCMFSEFKIVHTICFGNVKLSDFYFKDCFNQLCALFLLNVNSKPSLCR